MSRRSVVGERNAVTDPATTRARARMNAFFLKQRQRLELNLQKMPPTKAARREEAIKADPAWWDSAVEDKALQETMRGIYVDVGLGAMQGVADDTGRIIYKGFTNAVLTDLEKYGATRIVDINERTLQAVTLEMAEGTRRGYSVTQLIEGVPDEGFKGISGITLENGTPAFGDLRSETIARTESALSYNRATVTSYAEFGVTHLLAYDGDDDPECAERNGQEFTVEEAAEIEDHPNGTLVWSPVVEDRPEETPEEEAPVTADRTTAAEEQFSRVREEGGLLDRTTGRLVSESPPGTSESLDMTQQFNLVRAMSPGDRANFALTHSHPGQTSFSTQDILLAREAGVGEMRAVAGDWLHSITPGQGGWPARNEVSRLASKAYDDLLAANRLADQEWSRTVLEPALRAIREAGVEITDATNPLVIAWRTAIDAHSAEGQVFIRDIQHRIWEIVARQTGMNYRRTAR